MFDLLTQVSAKFDPPIVLRIAGGWVRNSLLKLPCNDFDVAIETTSSEHSKVVTGEIFANVLMEYQRQRGGETRSIGVIKRNPQQSKHIEAASTHIYGIPVDFLHLRREEYFGQDHRIPVVASGTIHEDALRRDFTVNALYYNLHTGEVEDYVGGTSDLAKKVLRCPLDPHETFLDDPLRVLRGIRFAAQFDLSIDAAITHSAQSPEIQHALLHKVSRERVSKEITLSVERSGPLRTFHLLRALLCLESTFRFTPAGRTATQSNFASMTIPLEWQPGEHDFIEKLAARIEEVQPPLPSRAVGFFLAVFVHRACAGEDVDRIESVLVDSLKLSKKMTSEVLRLICASMAFVDLLSALCRTLNFSDPLAVTQSLREIIHPKGVPLRVVPGMQPDGVPSTRIELFTLLRSLEDVHYRPALLCAVEFCFHRGDVNFHGFSSDSLYRMIDETLQSDPSKLVECHAWRPMLRGNQITKHLSISGPAIKSALRKILHLAVDYPQLRVEDIIQLAQQSPSYFSGGGKK